MNLTKYFTIECEIEAILIHILHPINDQSIDWHFTSVSFVHIYNCIDCKNAYVIDQLTRSEFYLILASVELQPLAFENTVHKPPRIGLIQV